jgi:hypothetical protein
MKYCIIDTGFKGSIVLFEDAVPIDAFLFKKIGSGINIREASDKILEWIPEKVYIEIFPAQPYQGVSTTAAQWRVIGQIDAICMMFCDVIEYIYVATWTSFTKRLSLDPNQPNKNISQELSWKYYPEFSLIYKKTKLIHDGVADCLTIGLYVNRDEYLEDLN